MAQLAQCLGFYLADAFARDVELLADFFQGVVGVHFDTEAHAKHLGFTRREAVEHVLGHFAQACIKRRIGRRQSGLIFNEIAKMRVVVVTDGGFHRDRLLGNFKDFADFLLGHFHARSKFRGVGFLAGLLQNLARNAIHLVDGLDHVNRDANGACLIGDRARDGLTDPPGSIGREFVAAAIFKFIDGFHEADVAFLNQVEEL